MASWASSTPTLAPLFRGLLGFLFRRFLRLRKGFPGRLVPDLTLVRNAGRVDDLILEVELEVGVLLVFVLGPVFRDVGDEVVHVAREQLAGVDRHAARKVDRPEDLHVFVLDGLPWLGQLAVASALGREVDDHRPRFEALYHLPVNQPVGLPALYERRSYDDVHLLYTLA